MEIRIWSHLHRGTVERFKLVRISGKRLERNIRRRKMWGRILRQVGDKGMVGVGEIRKIKKSSREV